MTISTDDLARLAELLADLHRAESLRREGTVGPYTHVKARHALHEALEPALPALLAMALNSLRWEEAAIAMRNTHGCLARDCEQCAAIDAAKERAP